jgi:hypothetical protein
MNKNNGEQKESCGREKQTMLERFLRGSSDEVSYSFLQDLHLSKDMRAILVLRYCHHLLEKEIAGLLNIDERTVRQRCIDAKFTMETVVIARLMNEYHKQIKEKPVDIPPIDALLKSC